jgi:signal transduction histidine kinase
VLEVVFVAVRELVPCDGGWVDLVDGDSLDVVSTYPDVEVPADADLAFTKKVIATSETIHFDDVATAPDMPAAARARAADHGVRSFVCVPLICLGETIGALGVFASQPGVFDREHTALIEGLAIQVAGAIESARRYRMVTELEVLKSDFIARVSHELRTPITIMSGFMSTLLANHDQLDQSTRRDMLERVDTATTRLSGLIDQLLMLSRLEAGVVAATIEPVDVAGALDEVRRQSIDPARVEIHCRPGMHLITDRPLLVRGLGFLVDNALKYAPSCSLVAAGRMVAVVDDGPGIPPSDRSRVFERFTRGASDTTIAGMGIGLPIARTLLGAAGAELSIEDNPDGRGCRVVARWV